MCDNVADCGYIAHTAPTIDGGGGPAWSGFICVMPWQTYLQYNDPRILEKAYPAQVKLLRFWNRSISFGGGGSGGAVPADGLVHNWGGDDPWSFLGDWLTPHGSEPSVTVEASLFNNCYILYCFRIVAKVASVLGREEDAAKYAKAATALAAAIHAKFFVAASAASNGMPYYLNTLQTHLTMALVAEVPPTAAIRAGVMKTLRHEIVVNQQGPVCLKSRKNNPSCRESARGHCLRGARGTHPTSDLSMLRPAALLGGFSFC